MTPPSIDVDLSRAAKRRDQLRFAREFLAKKADPAERLAWRRRLFVSGAHAGALCDVTDAEIAAATPNHLVDLAAILSEAGMASQAYDLVCKSLEKDENVLCRRNYPGLLSSLAVLDPMIASRFAVAIDLAARFRAWRGTFERLVTAAGTICVVGNSPIALGSGDGAFIDSHDLVIRFNDFRTDAEFAQDYGARTNIWAHSFNFGNIWSRDHERFEHTLLTGLSVYFRQPQGCDALISMAQSGHSCEEMDARAYFDLTQMVGAPPSSGLIVLYWLHRLCGTLDRVTIRGFSLVDETGPEDDHYFAALPRSKSAPHYWAGERAALRQLRGA